MLKKVIIILFGISLIFIFYKKDEDIIIPNNAIRFRVIANSDSIQDQNEKAIIKCSGSITYCMWYERSC